MKAKLTQKQTSGSRSAIKISGTDRAVRERGWRFSMAIHQVLFTGLISWSQRGDPGDHVRGGYKERETR